jgi:hypothetical protein
MWDSCISVRNGKDGNEAVVGLLLASGADVNAQGGEYGNALQAAALEATRQWSVCLWPAGHPRRRHARATRR